MCYKKIIYKKNILINNTKTKSICYIYHNDKEIEIYFKGTSTLKDYLYNMDIYPRLFIDKEIRVHNGFLKKYLSLKDDIIKNINKIIKDTEIREISLNGHSAGGAIANIASLDLSYIYENITLNCITFGSPKVGNIYFKKKYNKKISNSIRIVNNNDIIPLIPPSIIYTEIHEGLILENKNKKSLNFFEYTHSIKSYIKNLLLLKINKRTKN